MTVIEIRKVILKLSMKKIKAQALMKSCHENGEEEIEKPEQEEGSQSKGSSAIVGEAKGLNKDGGHEPEKDGAVPESQTQSGKCVNCDKRLLKGSRCKMCKLLYHFKCEGTNKKQVDDCGIFVCRAACTKSDEFRTYKGKTTKEIATLKNNIYELEKVINSELTTMHQRLIQIIDEKRNYVGNFKRCVKELDPSLERGDTNTRYLLHFQVRHLRH